MYNSTIYGLMLAYITYAVVSIILYVIIDDRAYTRIKEKQDLFSTVFSIQVTTYRTHAGNTRPLGVLILIVVATILYFHINVVLFIAYTINIICCMIGKLWKYLFVIDGSKETNEKIRNDKSTND